MTQEPTLAASAQQQESAAEAGKVHFIRAMIDQDLASGKYREVVTRFPPEPNGYLHIGHAKSICLNFGLARDYKGRCNLRFDDTNPAKEDTEYVDSIQADVRWLGFEWSELHYASEYFGKMYELAEFLIREGKAYVDSLNEEQIRAYRGTVNEPGKASPYRDRSVEENLELFRRMRAGEFADGAHVLRAKIDMAAANMKLRDPLLYRIRHVAHHQTGDAWVIYPMYDFAHPISDLLEGITHSICTLEFENNRDIYDWLRDNLNLPAKSEQTEFARLNLSYTVMSKRKLLQLVSEKQVTGWDDPRMPTIAGMRRRGYRASALRTFCERIGVAKANSMVDLDQLEACVRDDLNPLVPRVMAIHQPLALVIADWPEDQVAQWDASLYPHDVPLSGSRKLPFGRRLWIERDDFMEQPPKGYYRLKPGGEVRLRHGYIVKCQEVLKNEAGEVIELRCSHDPATLGSNPSDRKVKGTIHWVHADSAVAAEFRVYDRLFNVEKPDAVDGQHFSEFLNPHSLIVQQGYVEPAIALDPAGSRYQFERMGYYYSDPIDSRTGHLVYNRTVALRDSWSKHKAEEGGLASVEKTTAAVATPAMAPAATPAPAALATALELGKREQLRPPEQEARFGALTQELGIHPEQAELLLQEPALDTLFEQARAVYPEPKAIASWVSNDLARELKSGALAASFDGARLGELVALVGQGKINTASARELLPELLARDVSAAALVAEKGLEQLSDADALGALIDRVLAENADALARYREGKTSLKGFFVGAVMKASGGKANPKLLNEILAHKL